MSDEAKAKAEEAKARGNEAYKARQFSDAVSAYEEAIALYPTDPVYRNNLAAVFFELGDWDRCVEACEKAVEVGREQRADYKVIAKSFARIGSAYLKKGDYAPAIKNLEKSLTEHRTPEVLVKLKEAEKAQAEAEKQAYINPELGEKAREEGNACFKAGDFATSVKHYTEAIKRNPRDAKALTNRAAAYTKLLALPEALKDADAAIAAEPGFVKAHLRKSVTLLTMKEYNKALNAVRAAEEADVDKKHATEIHAQMQKCVIAEFGERADETDEQRLERAMRDPDVQRIMSDPVMQQILQQSQEDPKALQDHVKNPQIRKNVETLIRAGIIRTGPR